MYAWPLDQLLQRFKFNGDLATGRLLSELLTDYLAAGRILKPDLLIPVPLHAARLRKRGFNQALELARPVARRLRLRVAHHSVCVRSKDSAVQSELDSVERHRNLHAAFAIHKPPHGRACRPSGRRPDHRGYRLSTDPDTQTDECRLGAGLVPDACHPRLQSFDRYSPQSGDCQSLGRRTILAHVHKPPMSDQDRVCNASLGFRQRNS
ncbi:MAG TPA: hypothetical protein VNI53_03510 [Gammaproteobacteria bacterium]|nr:hypothetical protein [Gammaproteobacteria bacterium]